MTSSIQDDKAVALMGYFANYAKELLEVNQIQAAQLASLQQLLGELVRELGPAALVHPNPVVREMALEIKDQPYEPIQTIV